MAMGAERDDDAISVNSGSGPKSGSRKKQEAQRATYRAPEYNMPPF